MCATIPLSSSRKFSALQKDTLYTLSNHSSFSPSLSPGNPSLLSVPINLPILDSSYTWNHKIYGLLCPVSFT